MEDGDKKRVRRNCDNLNHINKHDLKSIDWQKVRLGLFRLHCDTRGNVEMRRMYATSNVGLVSPWRHSRCSVEWYYLFVALPWYSQHRRQCYRGEGGADLGGTDSASVARSVSVECRCDTGGCVCQLSIEGSSHQWVQLLNESVGC